MIKKIINIIKDSKPISMEKKIIKWRNNGIKIGSNCFIYSNLPEGRDCFLLSIGDNVTISENVVFLCHDSSIGNVTNYVFTDILAKIVIGNNCFIGYGSIILPGVILANGTVVGAGSVVTKSCLKENCVIAGNPAKIISSRDYFLQKNYTYGININGMTKKEIVDYIDKHPEKIIKQRKTIDQK